MVGPLFRPFTFSAIGASRKSSTSTSRCTRNRSGRQNPAGVGGRTTGVVAERGLIDDRDSVFCSLSAFPISCFSTQINAEVDQLRRLHNGVRYIRSTNSGAAPSRPSACAIPIQLSEPSVVERGVLRSRCRSM